MRTESKNLRVLIVEDDADTRELYCEALKILDVHSETAACAKGALEALAPTNDAPTAVILDLNVPGMPTAEFHEKLIKTLDRSRTKLIVISGADTISEQAKGLGAWRSLRKPFELGELLSTMRELRSESTIGA